MQKILLSITFFSMINLAALFSQSAADTTFYLLTCGPGTETYSIYGHSAIRVVIPGNKTDIVYNWGVFDFNTPNFAWKFAKGRLDYLLVDEKATRFLQAYFYEKRVVQSQKINLDTQETKKLIDLINQNLLPENVNYRYDFFYDDCSTRIRDLLEKAVGKKLLYPPVETGNIPTFRKMVAKCQKPFPWLTFGIDLIMGSPGDKKAMFRDRMFLPADLQTGLSEAVINREGKMVPLVQNPEVILDFDPPVVSQWIVTFPSVVFSLLMIIILVLSGTVKSRKYNRIIDLILFSVYGILALLMIFFNFFTDHMQMKWNLNIIWLNPFILFCLVSLILNKAGTVWFRTLFYISAIFLVIHLLLPQEFNIAFIPLIVILLARSSVRSGFEWNPLSIN
jgi:hypothetical protein